jgi:DNA-binding FrmR family transcriptional regulator
MTEVAMSGRPDLVPDDEQQLLPRLARIEGQIRGLARMIEAGRPCIDILTQVTAAKAALDQVSLALLARHTRACMAREGEAGDQVNDVMNAVGRMVGH